MTPRQLIITLVVLIGLGILFVAGKLLLAPPESTVPAPTETAVYCTMDAKICPDGSAVGRIPPNCQFAQCPLVTSTTTGTFTLALGEKGGIGEVAVTPLNVLEDSRCGLNVVCIQAGTVRVRVELASRNLNTTDQTIELNKSLVVGGRTLTLTEVSPSPYAGRQIPSADYRFTFKIE